MYVIDKKKVSWGFIITLLDTRYDLQDLKEIPIYQK